ncbi:ABC transporter substrate-binding protein [Brachybacterium sp. DNPG3]
MASRRMFMAGALGAGALSAVSLSACGSSASSGSGGEAGSVEGRGAFLRLGALQEPLSWDPSQAHVGHTLQPYQAVYDTLLLREPDGTLAPMLATEWGYTDDSHLVMALTLRTDVTFSDGAAFDADAVVANIENFRGGNGRQASQAAAIESVAATGEDTVEITLSEPDSALEYYLSQALGLMGSPDAIGGEGIQQLPVGSGPYTMVAEESVVGGQYVFEARDGYWNPDLQKWDRIELRIMGDATARVNALVAGEVDATLVDGATFEQAESSGSTLLEYPTDWSGLLLMDRDGDLNPALADPKVRQAINFAFDRESLLQELVLGHGTVSSQVFGPDASAYDEELESYYTYDPDKARSLLAEAGYADGVTIQMPTITPGGETIMTFVAQQLSDVGITVEQVSVPSIDYQGELGQAKYAAAWFNLFQGPTWVAISQMIKPEVLYNPFDSTTSEMEEWIEEIRIHGDEAVEAAQAMNRYLVENAWFAPFYRPSQLYFYDAAVVTPVAQTQMAVPSIYNYEPVL